MQHLLTSDFGKPTFEPSLAFGWLGRIVAREYMRECERLVTALEKDQHANGVTDDYAVDYFRDEGKSTLRSICERVRVTSEEQLMALEKISRILLDWAEASTSIEKRQIWVFELIAQYEERLCDVDVLLKEVERDELFSFSMSRRKEWIFGRFSLPRISREMQLEAWHFVSAGLAYDWRNMTAA